MVMEVYRNQIFTCYEMSSIICDALRDLVPFAQFRNREKQPWSSVSFSKVADF